MLAVMQERTQYRPIDDTALMRWIVGKLVGLRETVLAHLPEVGKGSGNPTPKLADRWKSGVWLGKNDLTDKHLVRTDNGVVYARSARRLAEHSWSEDNLKSITETPQKPRSTTTDVATDHRAVPEVHEHENQDKEVNDNDGEDEESPDKPDDEVHEMEGETLEPTREAHRNTRECVREKTADDEVTKATDHKRRLLKRTDMRNDESVSHEC